MRTTAALILLGFSVACASGEVFTDAASDVQPVCRYALDFTPDFVSIKLHLGGTVGTAAAPAVELGVAAERSLIRKLQEPKRINPEDEPDTWEFVQRVSWEELGSKKAPEAITLGLRAVWQSPDSATPVRVERYLVQDGRAAFASLTDSDPGSWEKIEIDEYRQKIADARDIIHFNVRQPMDGRLTMVIEDADGKRIRNLISGATASAGEQRIEWDGCDEDGNLVAPGSYRWRTLHHPGLRAEYLRMYGNGRVPGLQPFGSDHCWYVDACANSDSYFVSAPMAEGGFAVARFDKAGNWLAGYKYPHGTPHSSVAVAADENYFYAANVGIDMKNAVGARHTPDWTGPHFATLTRFNIETRRAENFTGQGQFHRILEYEAHRKDPAAVRGMALVGDRLYVSAVPTGGLMILHRETGEELGRIELPEPGALAVEGTGLLAVSGDKVVRITLPEGRVETVTQWPGHKLTGLATDKSGRFYVSDASSHQIIQCDATGRELGRYGIAGGHYAGKYDPARLVEPRGIVVFDNRLIVTENREQPKRFLQFDIDTRQVAEERFGNPPYGASGGGFDEQNPTRWVGMGCEWEVDPHQTDADVIPRPNSIFSEREGHFGGYYPWAYRYRYEHLDGRTFLIGSGFVEVISEVQEDGSLRDLAAFSSVESWRYGCGWEPPPALDEAIRRAGITDTKDWVDRYRPVLWVDKNGDGLCSVDEFDVFDEAWRGSGSRWGNNSQGLAFSFGIELPDKEMRIVHLEPQGWYESGAPVYPALRDVIDAAPRIAPAPFAQTVRAESTVDRFGVMLQNADPWMLAYAKDGRLLWRMANRWVGVHGSHPAPLPEQGVMQGNLFFLGCVPLDEGSDVVALNGNHGRYFFLTSDGFYVDELFRDVRMTGIRDDQMITGEPFGGFLGRTQEGRYYLTTGGGGHRIYELHGLDKAERQEGAFEVTPAQVLASERRLAAEVADERAPRIFTLQAAPERVVIIDARLNKWEKQPSMSWDKQGQYLTRAWMAADDENLYMAFHVRDNSPWVNHGDDWQTLFKTGDAVDLQLGTNPAADPQRRAPVVGDLRLLIAPQGDRNVVVLYRHRLDGKGENPVTFTSPWRSETVDDVRLLEDAKVAVRREKERYSLEVSVPLADLGWQPQAGATYRCDLGVIFGDSAGTVNLLRSYWANEATGLVNDVPGEIMLSPFQWGDLKVEAVQ